MHLRLQPLRPPCAAARRRCRLVSTRMCIACIAGRDLNHEIEKMHEISHRIHGAGIYTNIGGILMVNVTIYSIHGSYGYHKQIMKTVNMTNMSWFLFQMMFVFAGSGCNKVETLFITEDHVLFHCFQEMTVTLFFCSKRNGFHPLLVTKHCKNSILLSDYLQSENHFPMRGRNKTWGFPQQNMRAGW